VKREHARAILLALGVFVVAPAKGDAQQSTTRARVRPEARLDYLGPNPETIHAGVGANVPLGTYVRLELVAAGGASWGNGRSGTSARGDVIARFAFDPFRERRWALSAGGGASVRYDALSVVNDRWRALLTITLDLEGPLMGPLTPAFQLGLGGGTRIGMVVRWADRFRR
jgi:hypothetical protein